MASDLELRQRQAKALRQRQAYVPIPGTVQPQLAPPSTSVGRRADDLVRSLASGATFGFADELAAGARSALGEPYEQALAQERARDVAIPARVRIPGELVGGTATAMAGGPLFGPLKQLPNIVKAPVAGAAAGAASGAGHGTTPVERAAGAALGGVTGAGLGVALPIAGSTARGIGRVAKRITGRLPSKPAEAARTDITKAFAADEITPAQAAARLRKLGPEATYADVGGANVRGLARGAASQPGPARNLAERVLNRRAATQQNRIVEATRGVLSGRRAAETADEIIAQRSQDAQQLYGRAYAAQPTGGLKSPEITELLENQTVKRAIADARRMDPAIRDLPDNSMEVLDYAYKFVGGGSQALSRSGDTVRGHAMKNLQTKLKDAITKEVPEYADALNNFSDQSSLLDAMESGRSIFGKSALTAKMVKELPEGEREMFAIGAAEAIRDRISTTVDTGDAVRKIFGNPQVRDKLRAAIPDLGSYRSFLKEMLRENIFTQTRRAVQPSIGSQTQMRQAEVADIGGPLQDVKTGIIFGPYAAMMARGARMLEDVAKAFPSIAAKRENLGQMLLTPQREMTSNPLLFLTPPGAPLSQRMTTPLTVGGATALAPEVPSLLRR